MKYKNLKSSFLFTIFLIFIFSTNSFLEKEKDILEKEVGMSKKRVGVLRFEDISAKSPIKGDAEISLATMFTTALVETGKYEVIEREELEKVLKEQKLGLSGFLDEKSVKEVGEILGLDALLMGKLIKYTEEARESIFHTSYVVSITIDVRMVDVETGGILLAETAEGRKKRRKVLDRDKRYARSSIDQSMFLDAAREAISKIMEKIAPIEGLVAKVEGKEVIINLGSAAGIKEGMELKIYKKGEKIKDPATGELLEVEKIEIAKIKIIHVSEKISRGKILGKPKEAISIGDIVSTK